jgi:4-hydroxybenzoate polyprenyltransferase
MRTFTAFLRLIRWPNLFFIVLTQALFKFFIIDPILKDATLPLKYLIFLSLASVFIAAAGYIINDYFDLNIDLINKPDRLIVDRTIKRRWAIAFHLIFSMVGIVLSIYVALKTNFLIALGNILCVFLLWLYSTTFKKKLLIGNVVISLLTAWVIFVIYFAVDKNFSFYKPPYSPLNMPLHRLFRFALLYSSFAFIISLVREVVKDMEDIKGDAKYGCSTMPIKWGIPVSKVFVGVWLVVLIGALTAIFFYTLQLGWRLSPIYLLVMVVLPLVWILKKLYDATTPENYHTLSSAIKLVMLLGILSMLFMKIYS